MPDILFFLLILAYLFFTNDFDSRVKKALAAKLLLLMLRDYVKSEILDLIHIFL